MVTRAELKRHAKDQLKGKWGLAVGGVFVGIFLIPGITNAISNLVEDSTILTILAVLLSMIIGAVMGLGICRFSLNYAEEGKEPVFSDIFSGFQSLLKATGLYLLLFIIIFVGILLLVIPGIIFSFMFSQVFYILADDNSKSIIQCLKESSAMMKGHKFEYFVLTLSFLGWIILGIITLGIGLLWVMPYMNVTLATYYLKVKNSYYGFGNV